MTIAGNIKTHYTNVKNTEYGEEITIDYNGMISECDEKTESDQDFENESTKWVFGDGSVLILSGSEISVYGCE